MTELPTLGEAAHARFVRDIEHVLKTTPHFERSQSQDRATRASVDAAPERLARRDLIDPMLRALGWDIAPFSPTVVEEARIRSGGAKFADYLTIALPDGKPVLLIEAKAHDAEPPEPTATWTKENPFSPASPLHLIPAAVQFNEGPHGAAPLNATWMAWLKKAREYVDGLQADQSATPKVFAITSGTWWLVFTEPSKSLFGKPGAGATIRFFPTLQSVLDPAFQNLLARDVLIRTPDDTIEPDQLPIYCSPSQVKWVGLGSWTGLDREGWRSAIRPRLQVGPAVVIELTDGTVLRVVPDQIAPNILPGQVDRMPDHLVAASASVQNLLARVNAALPGLPAVAQLGEHMFVRAKQAGRLGWRYPNTTDRWVISLGQNEHFILPDAAFTDCPHHDHANTRSDGHAVTHAVVVPQVSPPVHFPSQHHLHCASKIVHQRREKKCIIAGFETSLCCRMCAYQSVCWTPEELADLPCNKLLRLPT